MRLHFAVIANERHSAWLAEWIAHVGPQNDLDMQAVALADICQELPALDADAFVVLVNGDVVPWARRVVELLRGKSRPFGFVIRSLKGVQLRGLLARGGHDFFPCNCRREELRLRLWKLGMNASPPRPAAAAATAAPARHPKLASLIGTSPPFLAQLERLPRFAACEAGVLILGETGTGKELVAQGMHYLSPRAEHPWVAINCGALPPELVEAELFGHARGAFTNAHETRVGLVAQAEGGTLFLDEVDSLPPLAQVKLLRFLQDKEYRPVGSNQLKHADVRILSASSGDLHGLCERGAFRTDLYYRLNVLTVTMPALRERGDDVIALAQHFLERFARQFGSPVSSLAPDALARLRSHTWPGNVRELQHTIERAVLMATGEALHAADLDLPAPAPVAESFHDAKAHAVALFERHFIEDALSRCDGNITHAADSVSKNRRAFWQLMHKHGIDSAKFRRFV